MDFALISLNQKTKRIEVHELPATAVMEPRATDPAERMWDPQVTIRFAHGATAFAHGATAVDTDPGHALMEVLGLYAEDGDTPRWRRLATGMPAPERDQTLTAQPHPADPVIDAL